MADRIQGVTPKEYNGVKYRSTLEAETARTLDLMGIPFDYEKKRMTLLDGFRCPYQKDKVRAIHYTPDFIVGNIILECKGFETPEWNNKKKYIFKYLMENEPEMVFYQIKDCRKQLLAALDNHWSYLGYAIQVTPKAKKQKPSLFSSVQEALMTLKLGNKPTGAIVRCMIGEKDFAYGYNWKLIKITI